MTIFWTCISKIDGPTPLKPKIVQLHGLPFRTEPMFWDVFFLQKCITKFVKIFSVHWVSPKCHGSSRVLLVSGRHTQWPKTCLLTSTDPINRLNKSSADAEIGDRLATTDMGRKWGWAAVPLSVGGDGSPSNIMWPGPRLTSIQVGSWIHPAIWPQQTWAENWVKCSFWWGAGSPSNTKSRGLRPIFGPSAIFIHPAVWPQ